MAGPILKRANALVWLPPRGDGRSLPAPEARLPCFVRGEGGAWVRQDASIETLAQRRTAVLLVDARDTVLLTPKLPPLSGAKLAQALPNAVEDMLLQDPASCVLALGPQLDDAGTRLVAACDRGWLEAVVQSFEKRGVAVLAVWPASLSLPLAAEGRTLACVHDGLALRQGELDAIGWPAGPDTAAREAAIVALMQATWRGPASAQTPLRVLIENEDWREPATRAAQHLGLRASIEPLAPPVPAPVELLAPLRGRLRATRLGRLEWRQMRWAAGLAAACVLAAVIGLNLHWMRMAREHAELRAALEAEFREAVPTATVVVDPVLQMRRQVATLRAQQGSAAPDDFVPLLARFAQALGPRADDAITSAEWREGTLRVRLSAGFAEETARDRLRTDATAAGLTVRFESGREPVAVVTVKS